MKNSIVLLSSFLLITCLQFQVFAQQKPTFVVNKQNKSTQCPSGGLTLEEGYVKANRDELIYIVIYLQKYDGSWVTKYFKRNGAGLVHLNVTSCDFTGNYYCFAAFSQNSDREIPSGEEVQKKHAQRGVNPRFRITKRKALDGCEGDTQGVTFEIGEVFTPRGEPVKLTLFMEKHDGSWRKKHYSYTGSGFIDIDISDCELTGKYKSRIVFANE